MTMNRRSVLKLTGTVAVASTAGCSGDTSDDGSNGDGSTPTPTSEGTQLSDLVGLPSHEWRGSSIVDVTVRNKTDSTIGLLQVDVNVYDGDTRIGDGYGTITDLPGGTEETVTVRISNFDAAPCEAATTYELVPNFSYEGADYEDRREYEYNPSACQ